MRMQKGLCIELNGEHSVFMGQSGEFVHGTPTGRAVVGEESLFYPMLAKQGEKRKLFKPEWTPLIAAVAVAMLFFSAWFPKQEAFAYVQIQVNPGVELGIDENYKVTSIRELNPDGHALIQKLGEWEQHSLEKVLDEVLALSMKKSTDEIVITMVADEEDQVADQEVMDSVMAISDKVMTKNVTVRLKEATKMQWRTSIEKSIPVGQLVNQSTKLQKNLAEKPALGVQDGIPIKLEKKAAAFKDRSKKEPLVKEKVEIKEEKVEEKEEKVEIKEEKAKEKASQKEDKLNTDKQPKENESKESSVKIKETPPGQEKRKETPAVEKGQSNPPGQEKRNTVPGQSKKTDSPQSIGPPAVKKQQPAPQVQKKQELVNPVKKSKESPVKEKDVKVDAKPAVPVEQNADNKKDIKAKESAETTSAIDKKNSEKEKEKEKE